MVPFEDVIVIEIASAPAAPVSPLIFVQEYFVGSVLSSGVKSVYWPMYNLLVDVEI